MPRFFVSPESLRNHQFLLTDGEAHHAIHVLRKKVGDVIDLFDGKDASFKGRIDHVNGHEVSGTIIEKIAAAPFSSFSIVLYQALSSGAKWDWMVEKVCEVGVAQIIPVRTARTIVKPAKSDSEKVSRWNRIALAATKQCGRSDVMGIQSPVLLSEALATLSSDDLSLIPWEKEVEVSIAQAYAGFRGNRVNIFIGPEGGWEEQEIQAARHAGVIPCRLGPTLLRTETAGLIAAILVLREYGIY